MPADDSKFQGLSNPTPGALVRQKDFLPPHLSRFIVDRFIATLAGTAFEYFVTTVETDETGGCRTGLRVWGFPKTGRSALADNAKLDVRQRREKYQV